MAEGKGVMQCPIPEDFCNRMNVQLGESQWAELQQALDRSPLTSVQINPNKDANVFADQQVVPWYANGRILNERPSFTLDPLYHAGAYYPQESSSMFLAHALKALEWPSTNDLRVLDLCAAPGGKSLILSHFFEHRGVVFCNEINRLRNAVLIENMAKSGQRNYLVAHGHADAWGNVKDYFDLVVVDAPCSGEGMFRKDMQARAEWSIANVHLCANRQREILSQVLPALRPGGYLIYSTCTFAPEENEHILAFLKNEFHLESVPLSVPEEWGIESVRAEDMIGYRLWPHRIAGEGLFMAVLKAPDHSAMVHRGKPKSYFFEADKKQLPVMQSIIDLPKALVDARGMLYHCPIAMEEVNLWAGHVYFTAPGLALGEVKQNSFIPQATLALSTSWSLQADRVEVDIENALLFLRGETPLLGPGQGLAVLTFKGMPLGWVKRIGHRCNNYHPKEWRIRMR